MLFRVCSQLPAPCSLNRKPIMFKKILIANRGEIAVRIIRACREMGILSVAVYSEADRDSLHVELADESICIGPAPADKSYLNIPNIISAAEVSGAEAIHPGYGFLSESARFADICISSGLAFIGSPPDVIEKLGDKARAKEMMREAAIPVIPGTEGTIERERDALSFAGKVGYPVMIKAAGGGGGRGMRIVYNERELKGAFHTTQSEAGAFFNNSAIYLEKYIEQPRHIEFQILADESGNVVHLGERDCSVQRRHQKLLEESPSIAINGRARLKMGRTAVKAAKAVDYVGAGTIEFLVDRAGEFYFIEANTRVQVEHPVTEMTTGIDIIREQINIASGERLSFEQRDVDARGHAIEFRINAEDPKDGFKPRGGKITFYRPPGGPGVRVDSHLYQGYAVPTQYDSLLAKMIVWGRNRGEALERSARALREFKIEGVPTTIPFHQWIVEHASFVNGDYSTDFVERHYNQ